MILMVVCQDDIVDRFRKVLVRIPWGCACRLVADQRIGENRNRARLDEQAGVPKVPNPDRFPAVVPVEARRRWEGGTIGEEMPEDFFAGWLDPQQLVNPVIWLRSALHSKQLVQRLGPERQTKMQ